MESSSEHVRALEQEITMLRRRVAQKDETITRLKGERNSQTEGANHTQVYPLLETTLSLARRGSAASKDLPLVGPLVKFGIRVADVGVRRLTPWKTCAEMEESIASAVPYIDEKVISPQINAYREVALAVFTPTVKAGQEALGPYYNAAQAFTGRVSNAARPVIYKIQPYVFKIESIARPLICASWQKLRPWVQRQADFVHEAVEDVNVLETDVLEHADPDAVYGKICAGADVIAKYVTDHRDDLCESHIANHPGQ
jgi:hypothetical protein